ncbi:hypothetical protein EIP86_000992 [Pleurotus ostreatoroseus]|nr:hypothetical protein EIP86_000992 [Pleurotus ostreatoroseus]
MQQFPWPNSVSSSLEDLSVSLALRRTREQVHFNEELAQMLKQWFPRLKALTIHNNVFNFKSWSLPASLTVLDIENSAPPLEKIASILDTVQALRQLSSLKRLSLVHALPEVTIADWPATTPISLPSLQVLSLHGSAQEHGWLLRYMEFPSTTRLNLALVLRRSSTNMTTLSSLSGCLGNIGPVRCASITVEGGQGWEWRQDLFNLKAWRQHQDMEQVGSHTVADFNLEFTIKEGRPASCWSNIEPLLATFPLSDIQSLNITCDEGSFFFAPAVYKQMNQVHSLMLTGSGESYSSGMRLMDLMCDCDAPSIVVFPKLRVIHASYVDFSLVHRSLCTVLDMYSENGQPLKVILDFCYNLEDVDIDQLKYYADVDWDGRTLDPSLDGSSVGSDSEAEEY